MSKAMVVGLTGPIGSGKSVVAKIFVQNGYMLIDADKIAREIVEKGSETLHKLVLQFGEDIINADETLNRKMLAKKAFSSDENAKRLNDITHPAIVALVKEKIALYSENGDSKIIYDAPLLFESGTDKLCDKVVTVVAQKAQRLTRVKKRDGMAESDIKSRMNAQHDDGFYTEKSDFVIVNDSDFDSLVIKTKAVIDELLR